jgi:hypothetical protein
MCVLSHEMMNVYSLAKRVDHVPADGKGYLAFVSM